MVNYVWQRDYQGLYDYDSREVARVVYTVNSHSLVLQSREKKTIREIGDSRASEEVEVC